MSDNKRINYEHVLQQSKEGNRPAKINNYLYISIYIYDLGNIHVHSKDFDVYKLQISHLFKILIIYDCTHMPVIKWTMSTV